MSCEQKRISDCTSLMLNTGPRCGSSPSASAWISAQYSVRVPGRFTLQNTRNTRYWSGKMNCSVCIRGEIPTTPTWDTVTLPRRIRPRSRLRLRRTPERNAHRWGRNTTRWLNRVVNSSDELTATWKSAFPALRVDAFDVETLTPRGENGLNDFSLVGINGELSGRWYWQNASLFTRIKQPLLRPHAKWKHRLHPEAPHFIEAPDRLHT